MTDYCADNKLSIYGSKSISDALYNVEQVAVIYPSRYMCTKICPCGNDLNLTTYWTESKVNKFNRTIGKNGTNGYVSLYKQRDSIYIDQI